MVEHMPRTLLALVAATVLVTGCGSSDTHNDADVAFAQQMVPHHEQAVTMSDLALEPDRGASAEVRALAEQIGSAQDSEIEQMNGWLEEWGEDGAGSEHGGHGAEHGDGHDGGGHDDGAGHEGMLTEEQLDELASATGAEFDALWLTSMIEHHEGAITMAQRVVDDGQDPDVRDLAEQIVQVQQDEIEDMRAIVSSLDDPATSPQSG